MEKQTKIILAVATGVLAAIGGGFYLLKKRDKDYIDACDDECTSEEIVVEDVDEIVEE